MGEERRKSDIIWANNWTKADVVMLTSKNVSGEPQKADKLLESDQNRWEMLPVSAMGSSTSTNI